MHLTYLTIALATSLFCSDALGLRVPVKDVREYRKDLEKREPLTQREAVAEIEQVFHEHEKRIVCIEDGTLTSFQAYEDESDPFCSSYLGIKDRTSTTTDVEKTTVTIIGTQIATLTDGTTTIPESTVTVTTTQGPRDIQAMLRKRQEPGVTPAASIFAECSQTPQNSSLISRVSSACSCLFLTTDVVVLTTSIFSTRTIAGIDYRDATAPATITTGVTTVTVTSKPTSTIYDVSGSALIGYSGNGTQPTGTSFSGTGYSGSGRPTGPQDTRGGEGVTPTSSVTSSMSSWGPRTTTYPPTLTSLTTSTLLATSTKYGTAVSSGTIIPLPPSNTSIVSPTGTAFPPLQGCPTNNGSRYSTQCQTFEIQCYINYGGPIEQGLIETDLYECIEGCAIANVGFSELRCYAASFIPSAIGPNCFFKTEEATLAPFSDSLSVSALLIANDTCSSNTTSTSSFVSASTSFPISSNSSMYTLPTASSSGFGGPTGSLNFNVSSRAGGTDPSSSTYSASMAPSTSMNISSISSGYPTASNYTVPTPTNTREASTTSGNSSSWWSCGGQQTVTNTIYTTSIIYETVSL